MKKLAIRIGLFMLDSKAVELSAQLKALDNTDLLFSASSVSALQVSLIINGHPDILLVHSDVANTPGLSKILVPGKGTKIVLLLDTDKGFDTSEYAGQNISGYYLLGTDLIDLGQMVRSIVLDGAYISPRVANKILDNLGKDPTEKFKSVLTRREMEILGGVCDGLTYKEIAEKLYITSFTVNQHLKKIYAKMNVRTKGELISKTLKWHQEA